MKMFAKTGLQTFFSTDIVKYQNPDGLSGHASFSPVALSRWLQVTLPLTLITLLGAWAMYRVAHRQRARHEWRSTPDSEHETGPRLDEVSQKRTGLKLRLYGSRRESLGLPFHSIDKETT
jgi:hypothetical protein